MAYGNSRIRGNRSSWRMGVNIPNPAKRHWSWLAEGHVLRVHLSGERRPCTWVGISSSPLRTFEFAALRLVAISAPVMSKTAACRLWGKPSGFAERFLHDASRGGCDGPCVGLVGWRARAA